MTDEEKLSYMKLMIEESESCRVLTNAQLLGYLARAGGNADGAIHYAALAKAKIDAITLPDGTTLPNTRDYWLAIAAAFRPNRGGHVPRVDGR